MIFHDSSSNQRVKRGREVTYIVKATDEPSFSSKILAYPFPFLWSRPAESSLPLARLPDFPIDCRFLTTGREKRLPFICIVVLVRTSESGLLPRLLKACS